MSAPRMSIICHPSVTVETKERIIGILKNGMPGIFYDEQINSFEIKGLIKEFPSIEIVSVDDIKNATGIKVYLSENPDLFNENNEEAPDFYQEDHKVKEAKVTKFKNNLQEIINSTDFCIIANWISHSDLMTERAKISSNYSLSVPDLKMYYLMCEIDLEKTKSDKKIYSTCEIFANNPYQFGIYKDIDTFNALIASIANKLKQQPVEIIVNRATELSKRTSTTNAVTTTTTTDSNVNTAATNTTTDSNINTSITNTTTNSNVITAISNSNVISDAKIKIESPSILSNTTISNPNPPSLNININSQPTSNSADINDPVTKLKRAANALEGKNLTEEQRAQNILNCVKAINDAIAFFEKKSLISETYGAWSTVVFYGTDDNKPAENIACTLDLSKNIDKEITKANKGIIFSGVSKNRLSEMEKNLKDALSPSTNLYHSSDYKFIDICDKLMEELKKREEESKKQTDELNKQKAEDINGAIAYVTRLISSLTQLENCHKTIMTEEQKNWLDTLSKLLDTKFNNLKNALKTPTDQSQELTNISRLGARVDKLTQLVEENVANANMVTAKLNAPVATVIPPSSTQQAPQNPEKLNENDIKASEQIANTIKQTAEVANQITQSLPMIKPKQTQQPVARNVNVKPVNEKPIVQAVQQQQVTQQTIPITAQQQPIPLATIQALSSTTLQINLATIANQKATLKKTSTSNSTMTQSPVQQQPNLAAIANQRATLKKVNVSNSTVTLHQPVQQQSSNQQQQNPQKLGSGQVYTLPPAKK